MIYVIIKEIKKEPLKFQLSWKDFFYTDFLTHSIAEPHGTREQTINAIKTCLERNEDLLDKLLYPNFAEDMNDEFL